MPTKEWIDSVIPNRPVFLTRSDLHLAVANSCALKLAGINRKSPDPEGGIIVKDSKSGEPNGLLKESAMKLVEKILPERSKEDKLLAISRGMEIIKTHGITSITELHDEDNFELFEELYFRKKLTARINYAPILETVDNFTGFQKPFSAYNNFLCRSAVKAFADGSFGSSTAWFFEPYNDDPSNFGLPTDYFATKKLQSMANRANKNDVQLIIHAIGDRAISETIDLYKSVNTEKSISLARHRIEHCQHMTEKDFLRFQKLKIIASLQPSHITLEGNCCGSILGSEREKLTYALNSFRKHNVKMIFGSDWPVVSPNVLTGIYYAVTRKLNDQHSGWIPKQRISVSDAVEAYTINGAYSMFQEKLLGSIEVGKLADLVVLDRDIFEIRPDEIRDVNIDRTVLNGEDIFRAS
jgi:predicted amidohydrolase YtcJ